jgi:hypothetical protein
LDPVEPDAPVPLADLSGLVDRVDLLALLGRVDLLALLGRVDLLALLDWAALAGFEWVVPVFRRPPPPVAVPVRPRDCRAERSVRPGSGNRLLARVQTARPQDDFVRQLVE